MSRYYPPGITTDAEKAEHDAEIAAQEVRIAEVKEAIRTAGLHYQTIGSPGYREFRLFEPLYEGKYLKIDQVFEICRARAAQAGARTETVPPVAMPKT